MIRETMEAQKCSYSAAIVRLAKMGEIVHERAEWRVVYENPEDGPEIVAHEPPIEAGPNRAARRRPT